LPRLFSRPDEAKAALDGLMAMQPGLTVSRARDQIPPTKNPADQERYLDALA